MKRTVIALLLCTALCATVFAQSEADFDITQNSSSGGGITITKYKGKAINVIIPATIEGIKVTVIGREAFFENRNITSVTIPNGVTIIDDGYYEDRAYDRGAFYGCTSLTSVSIPNSVTSIGDVAFYGCTSLASITIPNSVKSIGQNAFRGCTSLTSVTFTPTSKVTTIGDSAFYNCPSLTSITIPNSVTAISYRAFDFTGLTSVTIPNSVTRMDSAFYGCESLTSITIGANKNYAYVFDNNFQAFYESQGKKAGTYTWSGRLWSVK